MVLILLIGAYSLAYVAYCLAFFFCFSRLRCIFVELGFFPFDFLLIDLLMAKSASSRLLALDIMRGITIAGMILVNNAGSWHRAYEPLRHASWNGLTPTDLVFPFFMFIMGISTYMSLRKSGFSFDRAVVSKIVRRTTVIFLIGIALAWLSNLLYGWLAGGLTFGEAATAWERLRIMGVLQRLALSYGIGALLAVTVRRQWLPWLAGALIVVYAVIISVGNGYEFSERNIIGVVDRAILGESHVYTDRAFSEPMRIDPEGILGVIPSVAHVLIGFMCGALLCGTSDRQRQLNRLFIVGGVLTFGGLLLSYGLPLNKKIWSPTFVLTTCGLASTLLALLIWIIDVRGWKRWTGFFHAFGINPLYLYVQSQVLAYVFGAVQVHTTLAPEGVTNLKGVLYYAVLDPVSGGNAQLASLLWALLFVVLNWLPGYYLQRRKIYIKI